MNSVVIVAAGSGRRMNLDINKQYIIRRKRNDSSYDRCFL